MFQSGAGESEHHANILRRGFEPAQVAAGVPCTPSGITMGVGASITRRTAASDCR